MMTDTQNVIRIEPCFDQAGNANYKLLSTEKGKGVIQQCVVYPEYVIPVIFIPGVMGSNLNNNKKYGTQSIWKLDCLGQIFLDWFSVDAATRKVKLDPKNTEVDNNGIVNEKSEPFLLKTRRERGWGTVAFTSYSSFLEWLQNSLNDFNDYENGERYRLLNTVMETETGDISLNKDEVDFSYRFIYPVFAVGYNWLQSNADSAAELGRKIDEILRFYQGKGRKCEKVILITHSMGGLVARHYTQNLAGENKVLGVIHGVLPSLGAAATYRRMKAGTENSEGSIEGFLTARILGGDAASMTAVLSQSPGPLQLLPGREYGTHWLKIIDGKKIFAYPQESPYEEIYLQRDKWWGLCDEQFINPGKSYTRQAFDRDWKSFEKIIDRTVKVFIEGLEGKYHPKTWAFYSADKAFPSYGEVRWQSKTPWPDKWLNRNRQRDVSQGLAVNKTERFETRTVVTPFSGTGWYTGIQAYRLLPAEEAGDGTVPVRSGRIAGHLLQARYQVSVGHEPAFKNPLSQQFTLRALVKIVQQIPETGGL